MPAIRPNVLIAAAECRDLAKVGGLADVVRDLSKALSELDTRVRVIMPCYSRISHAPQPISQFKVPFGRRDDWPVRVFVRELDRVPVYLVESAEFFGGPYGEVYIDSERLGRGPFEDDAQRFAFFSTAVLTFIARHPELGINTLHAHDWHTAVALTLLRYDPQHEKLAASLHTLFTIHNLDYQGVRPFELKGATEFSSFADWFPELYAKLKEREELGLIQDRFAPIPCFNPMRAGINLADQVNTVSPTYAAEITQPDDPKRNFIGGRGLEQDLANLNGRLSGILNGLDYHLYDTGELHPPFEVGMPDWPLARRMHKAGLLSALERHLDALSQKTGDGFKNSSRVLARMREFKPAEWQDRMLVVAVTRLVRQKMSILLEPLGERTVLQALLERNIGLIVLGTGELEDKLEDLNDAPNGLFIAAFDASFANRLYAAGDLFLMPSDFEPCGISQMISMREGNLPLVPRLGGLKDTVTDMQTGFVYAGNSRPAAREALIETLDRALATWSTDRWRAMQEQAMEARFAWSAAAEKYIELYRKGK